MKIIVAIKQVPERDAQIRIDAAGKWIEESGLQYALNESDAYALEEALQLKEKHGGEVVVLTAGPERVGPTIREALAKGADRAIHIDCADLGSRDALGVARLLAAAVKPKTPTSSSPASNPTTSARAKPASFSPSCSACPTPRSSCTWTKQKPA